MTWVFYPRYLSEGNNRYCQTLTEVSPRAHHQLQEALNLGPTSCGCGRGLASDPIFAGYKGTKALGAVPVYPQGIKRFNRSPPTGLTTKRANPMFTKCILWSLPDLTLFTNTTGNGFRPRLKSTNPRRFQLAVKMITRMALTPTQPVTRPTAP